MTGEPRRVGTSVLVRGLRAFATAAIVATAWSVPAAAADSATQIENDTENVRTAVQAYVDAGVDAPIVFPLPWAEDRKACIEATLEAALPA